MTPANGIVEYELPGDVTTYTAGGTISGGNMVKFSGDRTVVQATVTNVVPAGIALHDAANGDTNLAVARTGVWPAVADGAITAGAVLKCGAAGKVMAWVSGTDAVGAIIGYALEAISDTATGRVRITL